MPPTLVSDSSVLFDLEHGGLLTLTMSLPYRFLVSDLLYERELARYGGEALRSLGLSIRELSGEEIEVIQELASRERRISIADASILFLAERDRFTLLVGDAALRAVAESRGIECHGVLWVLDELERQGLATLSALLEALSLIAGDRRCRLPRAEIESRLKRYSRE